MSARAMTGMDQHPDIMELRARYELAAARPLAQLAAGLAFLTGLYLAISPWVVGFNAMRSIAVNDLITGIALALIGACGVCLRPHARHGLGRAYRRDLDHHHPLGDPRRGREHRDGRDHREQRRRRGGRRGRLRRRCPSP